MPPPAFKQGEGQNTRMDKGPGAKRFLNEVGSDKITRAANFLHELRAASMSEQRS